MRRLDFCVPIYNEGQDVVKPLLDSIAIQRQVNFDEIGVIICCDGGSTVVTDEFMSRYPFHIEFHMCEHRGVSATRNECLRHSTAEYVQFADCDDMLSDAYGLFIVFREMDVEPNPQEMQMLGVPRKDWKKGFDFLISNFREETKGPDGRTTLVDHGQDLTFVHGKVSRRQWLIDNDLLFCESALVHEDSYWVLLTKEMTPPHRIKYCPLAWYTWLWRSDSVCRSSPLYILKTLPDLLVSNEALVKELLRRMEEEKAATYFAMITFEAFFTLNKAEWRDSENAHFRDTVEEKFTAYFRRYRNLWDKMDVHQKAMISQGVRQRSVMGGMLLEALTIDQWLNRILEKYPE